MKIVISIDLQKPEKDDDCVDITEDTRNFTTEEHPGAVHDQKIPSDYLSKFWNKQPKVTPPSKLGKKPDKKEKTNDKD